MQSKQDKYIVERKVLESTASGILEAASLGKILPMTDIYKYLYKGDPHYTFTAKTYARLSLQPQNFCFGWKDREKHVFLDSSTDPETFKAAGRVLLRLHIRFMPMLELLSSRNDNLPAFVGENMLREFMNDVGDYMQRYSRFHYSSGTEAALAVGGLATCLQHAVAKHFRSGQQSNTEDVSAYAIATSLAAYWLTGATLMHKYTFFEGCSEYFWTEYFSGDGWDRMEDFIW